MSSVKVREAKRELHKAIIDIIYSQELTAKEEKELFKLLYMRDRSEEFIPETTEQTEEMVSYVNQNTGLSGDEAKLFHLEMWAYVHGIATMFATGFFDIDWELVSKMLTDSYQGLRKQNGME